MADQNKKTNGAKPETPPTETTKVVEQAKPETATAESIAHTVTAEDITNNPDLTDNGIKAGDKIEIPETTLANPELDLTKFNYRKDFKGAKFREYLEFVATLRHEDQFVFEMHSVQANRKSRFPGIPNSPTDINGINVLSGTPKKVCKMALKHALEFNGKIAVDQEDDTYFTVDGGQWTDTGVSEKIYFFLKQD